jgi:hypothetical protein
LNWAILHFCIYNKLKKDKTQIIRLHGLFYQKVNLKLIISWKEDYWRKCFILIRIYLRIFKKLLKKNPRANRISIKLCLYLLKLLAIAINKLKFIISALPFLIPLKFYSNKVIPIKFKTSKKLIFLQFKIWINALTWLCIIKVWILQFRKKFNLRTW